MSDTLYSTGINSVNVMEAPKDPGVNNILTMCLDKELQIKEDLNMLCLNLGKEPRPLRDSCNDEPRARKPGTIDFAKGIYEMLCDISFEMAEVRHFISND